MKLLEYNKDTAQKNITLWRESNQEIIKLNQDYAQIREDILNFHHTALNSIGNDNRKDYCLDVEFGLLLYEYFVSKPWFNLRVASNDNFWRYISIAVIPDLVALRWGSQNDTYFWKQSNRLWPKSIWWYIFLTWQGSMSLTKNILRGKGFNSDIIQSLVERTGKGKGTFVEVYRELIRQYAILDINTIVRYKKYNTHGSDNLFRSIMRLNTALILVTDPCLCTGGVKGYIEQLFEQININQYK